MTTKVKISFPMDEKNITVEKDVIGNESIAQVINSLLSEIDSFRAIGKATQEQMKALYGKAYGKGWDRERIQKFLEENLGTSVEEEIVGKVDIDKLSDLISEIDEL